MPKPSDLPVWATDDLFPAGTEVWSGTDTKVEPTSGKQAEGWEPGERPPAQYMNWWQGLVYDWIAYLDGGIFDGDVEIDGNLHVTGNLDVDGDFTLDGDLEAGHLYFTEDRVDKIFPIDSGVTVHQLNSYGSAYTVTGNSDPIIYRLELPAGAVITGWTVYMEKSSGTEYVAKIFRHDTDMDTHEDLGTEDGGSATTTATGDIALSPSLAPAIVTDADSIYTIELYASGGNFNGGDTVGHALVSWVMPAP